MTCPIPPDCDIKYRHIVGLLVAIALIAGLAGYVCRGREMELREAEIIRLSKGVRG